MMNIRKGSVVAVCVDFYLEIRIWQPYQVKLNILISCQCHDFHRSNLVIRKQLLNHMIGQNILTFSVSVQSKAINFWK